MRSVVRAGSVIGACGLVLLSSGIARAQGIPELLSSTVGTDLLGLTHMSNGVHCHNRLGNIYFKQPGFGEPSRPCVNGPVNSGNSQGAANAVIHGHPNHSGNLSTHNGNANSGNFVSGAAQGNNNSIQRGTGGRHH
ncbi:hypothetical protein ACWGLP_23060 [Streptomyces lydicus]|uniref:hypothetical protein n=1 Tax=Streptomyces lydicus TaxID=47763 RepID=UPI0037CEB479